MKNLTDQKKFVKAKRATTRDRILSLLRASCNNWVLAPALSHVACAYTRCIHELRELGYVIENKVETDGNQRRGSYRLLERDPERSAHVEYWQQVEPEPEAPALSTTTTPTVAPRATRNAQPALHDEAAQPSLVEMPKPVRSAWADPEQQKARRA